MLTIGLPIHGRPEFVERFMALKLPFPVKQWHGDGWFTKIADGLESVETPYAVLADCDDFPEPDGLRRCVHFLDCNPDYVCASGRIAGVWLFPDKVTGPLRIRSRQYSVYDTPAIYSQDSVNERVLKGFANSWSYYAVYRTEALKTIWRECVLHNWKDTMVHEKFCAMRTLTLGKAACFDDFISLTRQYGTSQIASTKADWLPMYNSRQSLIERNDLLSIMHYRGVNAHALWSAWSDWYAERRETHYGPWARRRHAIRRYMPFLRKFAPLLEIMR